MSNEGLRARAVELLKCLICAGSGNVMHYGRNYGLCVMCDGRGYNEELAVKVADFAQQIREECAVIAESHRAKDGKFAWVNNEIAAAIRNLAEKEKA